MAFITGNASDATDTLCETFDNYEGMYEDKLRFLRRLYLEEGEDIDPDEIESFCKNYLGAQFNDERWTYKLSDVDFDEVAENWQQDC